ncbi:MAG: hypothetical protein HKM24_01675, partial [Gammaproteobacteria bacterium]|nr:hypothetical protein [Gammaproteobacteria bacterium]
MNSNREVAFLNAMDANHYILRLLALFALTVSTAFAVDIDIDINDNGADYVFTSGAPASVTVTVSDPGISGADVMVQWLDPERNPLSSVITLTPSQPTPLTLPSNVTGHYDLRFTTNNNNVRFPPQDASYHLDYGFSVLPAKTLSQRQLDHNSFFGMVHAGAQDPYLAGWIKTKSWIQTSPYWLAFEIGELQNDYKLQEIPLISGGPWSTSNDVAITSTQLNALGDRFGDTLDELISQGGSVPIWQLGVEENGSGQSDRAFYYQNLAAKAARLKSELSSRGLNDVAFMNSYVNFDYSDYVEMAQSDAAQYIDILGFDTYKWRPGTDFETPESDGLPGTGGHVDGEWLKHHIERLKQIMTDNGGPSRMIMAEYGMPHHGNNNPNGWFGYPGPQPAPQTTVTLGGSRDYVSRYLVKSHLIAMATGLVEQLHVYNYYDRGNDPQYPEHHFGLRSHVPGASGDAKRLGPTKPAYVAYAMMVDALDALNFVTHTLPQTNIWNYEFTDPNGSNGEGMLVAWAYPEANVTVDIASLKSGLDGSRVDSVVDLYGRPVSMSGNNITLNGSPKYIAFSNGGGVNAPSVSLAANPTTVSEGDSSTLTWTVSDATSCTASDDWSGSKTATGGSQVMSNLTATSTYTLICTGAGGSASDSVTITVNPLPVPTVSIDANPKSVNAGDSSLLTWSST